jgi:hypothetical protein
MYCDNLVGKNEFFMENYNKKIIALGENQEPVSVRIPMVATVSDFTTLSTRKVLYSPQTILRTGSLASFPAYNFVLSSLYSGFLDKEIRTQMPLFADQTDESLSLEDRANAYVIFCHGSSISESVRRISQLVNLGDSFGCARRLLSGVESEKGGPINVLMNPERTYHKVFEACRTLNRVMADLQDLVQATQDLLRADHDRTLLDLQEAQGFLLEINQYLDLCRTYNEIDVLQSERLAEVDAFLSFLTEEIDLIGRADNRETRDRKKIILKAIEEKRKELIFCKSGEFDTMQIVCSLLDRYYTKNVAGYLRPFGSLDGADRFESDIYRERRELGQVWRGLILHANRRLVDCRQQIEQKRQCLLEHMQRINSQVFSSVPGFVQDDSVLKFVKQLFVSSTRLKHDRAGYLKRVIPVHTSEGLDEELARNAIFSSRFGEVFGFSWQAPVVRVGIKAAFYLVSLTRSGDTVYKSCHEHYSRFLEHISFSLYEKFKLMFNQGQEISGKVFFDCFDEILEETIIELFQMARERFRSSSYFEEFFSRLKENVLRTLRLKNGGVFDDITKFTSYFFNEFKESLHEVSEPLFQAWQRELIRDVYSGERIDFSSWEEFFACDLFTGPPDNHYANHFFRFQDDGEIVFTGSFDREGADLSLSLVRAGEKHGRQEVSAVMGTMLSSAKCKREPVSEAFTEKLFSINYSMLFDICNRYQAPGVYFRVLLAQKYLRGEIDSCAVLNSNLMKLFAEDCLLSEVQDGGQYFEQYIEAINCFGETMFSDSLFSAPYTWDKLYFLLQPITYCAQFLYSYAFQANESSLVDSGIEIARIDLRYIIETAELVANFFMEGSQQAQEAKKACAIIAPMRAIVRKQEELLHHSVPLFEGFWDGNDYFEEHYRDSSKKRFPWQGSDPEERCRRYDRKYRGIISKFESTYQDDD